MDSPEVDRLPLSHCYVVHHPVVGLRIPLAADGQPCRHKKQNPQREKECAFGKGGKVSPQRHGVESRAGGKKRKRKKRYIFPQRRRQRVSAQVQLEIILHPPNSARPPTPRLNPNLLARCSGRGRDARPRPSAPNTRRLLALETSGGQ